MSNTNTGGPAFPLQAYQDWDGAEVAGRHGMTLRDYFAAQVIGHLACAEMRQDFSHEQDASYAYMMADAMLKARES